MTTAPKWNQVFVGGTTHTMSGGAIASTVVNGIPRSGQDDMIVAVYLDSNDATAILHVFGRLPDGALDNVNSDWMLLKKVYAVDYPNFGKQDYTTVATTFEPVVDCQGVACADAETGITADDTTVFYFCLPATPSVRFYLTGAAAAGTKVLGWVFA